MSCTSWYGWAITMDSAIATLKKKINEKNTTSKKVLKL